MIMDITPIYIYILWNQKGYLTLWFLKVKHTEPMEA